MSLVLQQLRWITETPGSQHLLCTLWIWFWRWELVVKSKDEIHLEWLLYSATWLRANIQHGRTLETSLTAQTQHGYQLDDSCVDSFHKNIWSNNSDSQNYRWTYRCPQNVMCTLSSRWDENKSVTNSCVPSNAEELEERNQIWPQIKTSRGVKKTNKKQWLSVWKSCTFKWHVTAAALMAQNTTECFNVWASVVVHEWLRVTPREEACGSPLQKRTTWCSFRQFYLLAL